MTPTTQIPNTITLHVPFRVAKRGGRKEMRLPIGAAPQPKTDNSLIKALARAFRWKRMLESGEFTTVKELAQRESIQLSYLARVLRLTLLAPDIIEEFLDGRQGPEVAVAQLLKPFPVEWSSQRRCIGARGSTNGLTSAH